MFSVSASDVPAAGTELPPGLMGMLSLQGPEELGQEAALQTLERLNAAVCWVQAQQARTVYRLQELTAQNLGRHPHPDLARAGSEAGAKTSAVGADAAVPAPDGKAGATTENVPPAADSAAADGNDRTDSQSRGGEWVLRATAAEVGALLCLTNFAALRLVSDSEQLCTRCP
ncbi:hypothetical protein, partial [Arthrobacter sp. zg-Y769]|uniref:hypothetical protein n=1 Tax=Arthrobacter sp. zg-Y769 TaxID=2894191 RepID=UPI001E4297B1